MTLPTIPLALRLFLAVLVVLFLVPWIFRRPLGELTGFLRDLRSLFRAVEENKRPGPTKRLMPDMAKLFLPTINRDFPAFNQPEEWIATGGRLVSVPTARQALDLDKLVSPSKSLWEHVHLAIEDDRMNGLTHSFSDIVIHRTVVADYKNLPTLTKIRIVSSVGFLASPMGESVKKSGGKACAVTLAAPYRVGTSVTSALVRVQSVNVESGYQKIVGISCSHCGTPLQCADARICPFCKSALVQTDSMVWSLKKIEFQTFIRVWHNQTAHARRSISYLQASAAFASMSQQPAGLHKQRIRSGSG